MTLYRKQKHGRHSDLIPLSPEDEAVYRRARVKGSATGPMFSIVNGFEVVLPEEEAAEIRKERAKTRERKSALVPNEVGSAQLMIELEERGLLKQADLLMKQSDSPIPLLWGRLSVFQRNHKMWKVLADKMDISPSQLDDIFRKASRRG